MGIQTAQLIQPHIAKGEKAPKATDYMPYHEKSAEPQDDKQLMDNIFSIFGRPK